MMTKALEENLPYSVVRLGKKCNARCLFCNVPAESFNFPEKVSLKEIKKEIKRLAESGKHNRISLSGGEPTIRKDLCEVIKIAKMHGAKIIEIQTNGVLLNEKITVQALKGAGLNKVFVGLHSHIADIHDSLVMRNNAFNDCLKGIKNAINANIEVILNPVLTKKNYKHLPDFIRFIKNEIPQVSSISLSVVQPRGRVRKNIELVPRYKLLDPYVKEALGLGKKNNVVINNPYCGLPLCIGGWSKNLEQCVEYSENFIKIKNKNTERNGIVGSVDKIKTESCFRCSLFDYCNGVWREYAELYPLTDLKPIKSSEIFGVILER